MFIKIDDWLFDKVFQPIADWFFDRYGKNTFWLAGTVCWFYVFITAVQQVVLPSVYFSDKLFDGFFAVWMAVWAYRNDQKAKRNRRIHWNAARKNFYHLILRKVTFLGTATCGLILIGVKDFWVIFILFGRAFAYMSIFYLEACNTKPPPPPKKSADLEPAYAT